MNTFLKSCVLGVCLSWSAFSQSADIADIEAEAKKVMLELGETIATASQLEAFNGTDQDAVDEVMQSLSPAVREYLQAQGFRDAGSQNQAVTSLLDLFEPGNIRLKERETQAKLTFSLFPSSANGLAGFRSINFIKDFGDRSGKKELLVEFGFFEDSATHVFVTVDSSKDIATLTTGAFTQRKINYFARTFILDENNPGYGTAEAEQQPVAQATASSTQAMNPDIIPILFEELIAEQEFVQPEQKFNNNQMNILVMAHKALSGQMDIPVTIETDPKVLGQRLALHSCQQVFQ